MSKTTDQTVDLGPVDREPPPCERLAPGDCVGRYVIEEHIGAGGMGTVWRAYDPKLERKVALKLLRVEPGTDAHEVYQARERLQREARALAQLSHPNVVAAYDTGTIGDDVFISMELVDGATLKTWMAAPRTVAEIVRVFVAAGRGLAAAHAAGLVHRDVKPSNILVGGDGRVRVGDFGVARTTHRPSAAAEAPSAATDTPSRDVVASTPPARAPLTVAGSVIGTPGYMAPEQYLGHESTARTDQYGFAASLFEALYGRRPFEASSFDELRDKVLAGKIQLPASARHVPTWLRHILERALSSDPDDRYPSMDELLDDIARKQRSATQRRLGAVGLIVLCAVAGAGAVVGWRESRMAPCRSLEARWDGVWDATTARTMESRFAKSGRGHAAFSFAEVRKRLDQYVASWTGQAMAACETTRVRGARSEHILDLRMACLDRSLDEAQARIAVLAESRDPATVDHAVAVVLTLPALSRCENEQELLAAMPPPEDPQARAQLEQGRRQLGHVVALEQVGRYQDGIAAARTVAAAADRLAYPPFAAEARLALATLEKDVDDFTAVARDLDVALAAATRAHDDQLLARAWVADLANLAKLSKFDAAHALEVVADLAASRADAGFQLRSELLRSKARIRYEEGRYDDASPLYARAVEVLTEALGAHDLRLVEPLVDVGNDAFMQGRLDEALAAYDRALGIGVTVLGPQHPSLARVFANRALVYHALGRRAEARADYLRGLDLAAVAGGADSARLINMLGDLGLLEREMGDLPGALSHLERQLALSRSAHGERDVSTALARANVALIHLDNKQYAEARAGYQSSLATLESLLGPKHPWVSYPLLGIGACDVAEKRYREAIPLLERSLAISEAAPGDAGHLSDARFELAKALWGATHQRSRAAELARSARAGYASFHGRYADDLAKVDRFLATLP